MAGDPRRRESAKRFYALRPTQQPKPSTHLLLVPSLLPQSLNPTHNLRSPLLRPPVCCGRSSSIVVLSSRACLLLDALCLSEALVSFRRQRPLERRFSCRLVWAVCVRSLLRAISDMRVSVRLLLTTSLVEGRAYSALCPSLLLLFVLTAPRPRRRRICRARPGST